MRWLQPRQAHAEAAVSQQQQQQEQSQQQQQQQATTTPQSTAPAAPLPPRLFGHSPTVPLLLLASVVFLGSFAVSFRRMRRHDAEVEAALKLKATEDGGESPVSLGLRAFGLGTLLAVGGFSLIGFALTSVYGTPTELKERMRVEMPPKVERIRARFEFLRKKTPKEDTRSDDIASSSEGTHDERDSPKPGGPPPSQRSSS